MWRERFPALKLTGYLLLLFLFYLIETANGIPISVCGYRIEVLCCFVAAAALFDGPMLGGCVGFAVGVLYDLSFIGVEGAYPIYFMLFGIFAGFFAERFLQKIFPSMLLLTGSCILLLGAFRFPVMLLTQQLGMEPLRYMQQIFAGAILAAAFSPFVYFSMRYIYRRFQSYYS